MNSKLQEKIILDVGTWGKTFQELIQEGKPRARWTLKLDETLQPDRVAQGWKQYQQRAFGRFRCSSCKQNWASAQVQILCHMHLEPRKSQGQVLMRLFCQRCQKCSRSRFEKPEFSSESTMRILSNLVRRIRERYYGDGVKKHSEILVKPEVPLEGSHDMANCEACVLGFCVQSSQNCMTKPFESPLSYMEIGNSLPHTGDTCGQNQARNQSAGAKEAQGSGGSFEHKVSGPSHATAGTRVPGAGPQPRQEMSQQPTSGADRQAACGTGSQPIQVAGSLPPGWDQPARAVGPLPLVGAHLKSTLGTGPQTPQRTYSQALRRAGQQSKQETGSQATPGAGLPATKGTDPQPTRRASPTATHGSGSFRGTQASWGGQDRYSPRVPVADSSSRSSTLLAPQNSHGQDNLIKFGCVCVAALWAFIVARYFK